MARLAIILTLLIVHESMESPPSGNSMAEEPPVPSPLYPIIIEGNQKDSDADLSTPEVINTKKSKLASSEGLSPVDPSVFEGHCIPFKPAKDNKFAPPPHTGLFSVFGSQAHFRVMAEAFLGRLATSQEEINELCHEMLLTGNTATHICYGDRVYASTATKVADNVLQWPPHPIVTNGVFDLHYLSTITWTNEDHILFCDCFNKKFRKWKLVSRVMPTEKVKATVLEVIEKLGFNKSLAWDMTNVKQTGGEYKCCKTPPSLSEVGAHALLGLHVFKSDNKVHRKIDPPIEHDGDTFTTMADYYGSFLGPIKPFVQMAIKKCGGCTKKGSDGEKRSKTKNPSEACKLLS